MHYDFNETLKHPALFDLHQECTANLNKINSLKSPRTFAGELIISTRILARHHMKVALPLG